MTNRRGADESDQNGSNADEDHPDVNVTSDVPPAEDDADVSDISEELTDSTKSTESAESGQSSRSDSSQFPGYDGEHADSESTSGEQSTEPSDRDGYRLVHQTGESSPKREPPTVGGTSTDEDEYDEWVLIVRDVVTSVAAVALIGVYLFAISGVWPPMVAIESGSMEPNMDVNDLVFVMDADRFQPEAAHEETGVVPADRGEEVDYVQFGAPGDVIVFNPNGDTEQTPVIHRAMLWVEEGENWVERAEPRYLGGVRSCAELPHVCPAPNAGFITKGDNNNVYDQVQRNRPVEAEWIVGTAEVRIPGIGWLRLRFQ